MCTSRIKLQHFIHSLYSTHKVHHNNQCILPHHMRATLHSNRYVNEIYNVSKNKGFRGTIYFKPKPDW